MPQYHKKQKQAEVYHSPKKQKIVYNINSQVDKFVTELDSAGTAVVFIPNVKDGSSVTLLKDLKKNQQRLYYLHVEIICITQTTAEEIDEVKKVEEIDFQITNQDALKYARLFGTENKEKIKRSAFLLVGSTLRKKYNSFNAIGLADTIIRDAAIMVDLDEVSFEVRSTNSH
jgi:peroxiredoxin